jgi:DnaJ-domain-containing protein 1
MTFNKEIIIRLVFSFIFFALTFRVLAPVLFSFLKRKMPGAQQEKDLDTLIRRQKERLRSQYGLSGDIQGAQNSPPSSESRHEAPPSQEMKKIYEETKWGGGAFLKEIQQDISKTYSYTMADTKVNAFILLCEKRNYIHFLSPEHRSSETAMKNYLVTLLLLFLMMEELREKKFFVVEKVAKKLGISPHEFALALQIKILMTTAQKQNLKEERIFTDVLVLSQYSEETTKSASERIAKTEANLWAKNPSLFFEELTLALSFASMLEPMPKLKNKKDTETAFEILGATRDLSTEEIKKLYKKIALQKHPDKIVSQKLPKVLERKAFERFNKIQEAYEVIMESRK